MVAREVQKRTKRHQRSLPAATLKRKRKGGENEGARSLEVGAREHGLRIFQALLLVDARRLAHVVVLDDEVALRVEVEEQLLDVGQGRLLVHLLLLGGLDLRVEVGLRGLLRRDRLNVLRARLLGAAHEPLVILLRGLLLVLRGGDAVRELLGQHLHEGNDAIALPVLLLVRIPRRGRRRRRGIRALVQLGVDLSLHRGDRSAGDHLRGRGCDHVRPARRGEDLLLLGELLLRRFLVHVRAVELEEAILRLLDKLDSGVVLGLEGDEVLVLLLALLSSISSIAAVLAAMPSSVSAFSPSAFSISAVQKVFVSSSSFCSAARTFTIPSICSMILEKSTFFALSCAWRRDSVVAWVDTFAAAARTVRARAATAAVDLLWRRTVEVWLRERVFLNKSRASSSFKILMASLIPAISSARMDWRSAHSFFFIAHCAPRLAKNACVSFISAVVSSMSSAVVVTETASSPLRTVFDSIASPAAAISCFLAVDNSSKPFAASSSAATVLLRSPAISSFMAFSIPTISPLWPLYAPKGLVPCRSARSSSRW